MSFQILRCRAVLTVVDDFTTNSGPLHGQREIVVELDGDHPAVMPILRAQQEKDKAALLASGIQQNFFF
jgi:adenine/guanine phosphoribosyltransferase-like PRPP-binding protein